MASLPEREERLVVVVVGHVMAVAVHRPVEIFLEAVRMPVIGDRLQMILDRLEHSWGMGRCWHDGPDDQ